MEKREYLVGTRENIWREGNSQYITFIVTEDCNLRCKYCYITHKSSNNKMNLETAKKFIDYILTFLINKQKAVVIEFIGGEPLLEIDLIDQICDYFKLRTFETNNDWFWNYRISICTNGVNYSDSKIQHFINKNKGKISMTITIDGTKEKHDMQRVFPNGEGSYDVVNKNIVLWLTQFPGSTKVTFSSNDLKFLKESIIELWNKGITSISANVVFENVWKEEDDIIFENQLKSLADYIISNKCFDKYICSLFDDTIGEPLTDESLLQTNCGSGKMIALGPNGDLYPCMRFNSYSLNNKSEYKIGTVETGIDFEKLRPFGTLMKSLQYDSECLDCSIASGCSSCQAFDYDEADTKTNFQRAKYICKMHKARVRANNYYFAKLFNLYGIERKNYNNESKFLNFLLADDYVNSCSMSNIMNNGCKMSKEVILDGLEYCYRNFLKPVFIHSRNEFKFEMLEEYLNFRILHIIPYKFYKQAKSLFQEYLIVFDKDCIFEDIPYEKNCILNIEKNDIDNLAIYVNTLLNRIDRVNVNILNIDSKFNFNQYKSELDKIKNNVLEKFYKQNILKEVNLITDILFLNKHESCTAGTKSFTLAPNSNLYICPAFYSCNSSDYIGNIKDGLVNNKNSHLYSIEYQPLCSICDSYQCPNCFYLNNKYTLEVNVSPSFQCHKSLVEREVSLELQNELKNSGLAFKHSLNDISYKDPYEKLQNKIGSNSLGFYNALENYN